MSFSQVIISEQVFKLIPYGFCVCGCGQKTFVNVQDYPERGIKKGDSSKYIRGHNGRNGNHGSFKGRIDDSYGYIIIKMPDHPRADSHGYIREHILICEGVLGKPLPPKAEPHHIDRNRSNNSNNNLVICQDRAYHMLLHQRTRAYNACGHAKWRKCWVCKQYDAIENLYIDRGRSAFHRSCKNNKKNKPTMENRIDDLHD